jgi:S1-C subfamily serine protease
VLHLVAQELQNPGVKTVAVQPTTDLGAPQLFGPSSDEPTSKPTTPDSSQTPIKTAMVVDPNLGNLSSKLSRAQLVGHMRENVVMIYNADQDSMGTGFFISPNYILTNTHVVGSASKVVVLNRSMHLKAGIVKYRGMTPDHVGIDAAIIQVLNYSNPTYMTFASNVREGEDVAIGGYPYRALKADRGFIQFLEMMKQNQLPTTSQIPNTKYAFGVVQSVFTNNDTGLENIQEGVETTGGNSGSPLVNDCGQVVALHYEGSQAEVQAHGNKLYVDASKYNYAISFREVLKFLRDASIPYREAKLACPLQ